ncbi:uncharacterized protein LOC129789256, partial [Lutzomyia longipalpis]|uniref:uncharacterized protein LOC129789256 n=1 Tax=Lutzomyia longipalpis TaxID=7200 RepID=UPI00248451B1
IVNSRASHKRKYGGEDVRRPQSKTKRPYIQFSFPLSVDFAEHKAWLSLNCAPVEIVIDLWKKTSTERLQEIRDSPENILKTWPRYNDPCGYLLIDVDFSNLHPGKENQLLDGYDAFIDKVLSIYESDIKDKASCEFLKFINSHSSISRDEKDCGVLLLLCAILTPVKIKKTHKPSILDAQKELALFVTCPSDISRKIAVMRSEYQEQKLSIQPKLIIVGEYDTTKLQVDEIFVYFDEVKYKMGSIRKAVDTIIKLCFVFNIEYSKITRQIWRFLQEYFYQIDSPETSPAIRNLCNKLA